MLRKSGKHLSVFFGILFFVTITGGAWYLAANHSRKNAEPVKIYRVTQPAKKRVSDTTPFSVQTDTESASIQPEVSETKGGQTNATPMSTSSDTTDVSAPSDELGGQNTEASNSTSQQSNEDLAKERTRQQKTKELEEEFEETKRRNQAMVRELENKLDNLRDSRAASKAELEARRRALAKELNALSADVQRAYLEKQAANVTKAISEFHEKLRANPGRNLEEIEQLIKSMQQTLPELSPEEYMKRDIESLRKYGFEPKF